MGQLGKYELLKRLATGGMADLWLARAQGVEGFERHVVLKRIRAEREGDPRMVDMFLAEARLAAKLHHNNIVQVHDVGLEDGKPYFAMEYVHGVDVRQLLERVHRDGHLVPIEHVVTIGIAIATALHHAHEQVAADRTPLGIVHRDITPGNVLIAFDGTVKVADFGIAKQAKHGVGTEPGTRKGKAAYMSPEQCEGTPLDRRSDVFGLGILLHELATARRLFKGGNEYKTMAAVVGGEIPRPSLQRHDLPRALEAIILRALERDRDRRYPTARALADALDGFASEHRLRTSQTGLAAYIHELFGTRVEPWIAAAAPVLEIKPATLRVGDHTDVVVPLPPPSRVVLEPWASEAPPAPARRTWWWVAGGALAVVALTIGIGFSTELSARPAAQVSSVAPATPLLALAPTAPEATPEAAPSLPKALPAAAPSNAAPPEAAPSPPPAAPPSPPPPKATSSPPPEAPPPEAAPPPPKAAPSPPLKVASSPPPPKAASSPPPKATPSRPVFAASKAPRAVRSLAPPRTAKAKVKATKAAPRARRERAAKPNWNEAALFPSGKDTP